MSAVNFDKFKAFSLFLLLLLFFFPIKLKYVPVDTPRILYILIPFFFLYFKFVHRDYVVVSIAFVASAFWSACVAMSNGAVDLTFVRIAFEFPVRYLLVSPILAMLAYKLFGDNYNKVLWTVILVFFAQAVMILLTLMLPDFQEAYGKLIESKAISDEGNWRLRLLGFTGWSVYDMAVTQLLAVFIVPLCVTCESQRWRRWSLVFVMMIIMLSAIVSARTAFVGIAFLIFACLFVKKRSAGFFDLAVYSPVSVVLISFISCLVIGCVALIYLIEYSDNPQVAYFVDWVSEIFVNAASGSFSSSSTDELKKMYVLPNEAAIILGDGKYIGDNGGFYMDTDVGFLRVALATGLLGSLMFYLAHIFMFKSLIKNLSYVFRGYTVGGIVSSYLLFLFVVNAKGSIFVDAAPALSAVSFLWSYSMIVTHSHYVRCKC